MENYTQKIEEVLTQAVTEKTFSLEIIEKIKSLKDGFDASQKIIENYEKSTHSLQQELTDLKGLFNTTNEKLQKYIERENKIKDSEAKSEKKDYELEFQTKRANEIKEIMGIVFKNPVVRENVCKSISNGNGGYGNESGTITKEME